MRQIYELIKETFLEFYQDNSIQQAATLSFYSVLSLGPLVLLFMSITNRYLGELTGPVKHEIILRFEQLTGSEGAQLVKTILSQSQESQPSSLPAIFGLLILALSSTWVFAQLKDSMNHIWGVEYYPEKQVWGFIKKYLLSLLFVGGIGILILLSIVGSWVFNLVLNHPIFRPQRLVILWYLLGKILPFILFTVAFALIFKVFPDVRIHWTDVTVGALVTAGLFTLGKFFIGYYLSQATLATIYGATGSLIVILLWVYYSALILFFGAEFTQVYARNLGKPLTPGKHSKWIKPVPTSIDEADDGSKEVVEN